MNKNILNKLFHLSLRLLTMFAKFLLIIGISKYLGDDVLGEYSLFFTTITLAVFFLGMDFYVFTAREIIAIEHEKQALLIRDQFIFFVFAYAIILPILLFIFFMNIIDFKFLFLFYFLLITEHLSQELYRLFITLSKQTVAMILLFIRSGLWGYAVLVLWFMNVEFSRNIETIYISWGIATLISIIIALYILVKEYGIESFSGRINFQWIKSGVLISLPFFIGTISYKIVEFSNRYIIDFFMEKSDVGIFSFYANISNAIQVLVYTLVIMMYYPKLLLFYEKKDKQNIEKTVKLFMKEIIAYTLILSFAAILISPFLFKFLDKEIYIENIYVLWSLLAGGFFLNLSFVAHYQLYALKKDILIRNITLFIVVINILLTFVLVYLYGLIGAGIASLISFLLIFIMKNKQLQKVVKNV